MNTLDALMKRRSCRRYVAGKVSDDHLRAILEATRFAPSAGNSQPWRFVVVRDTAQKRELAKACAEQLWIADADLIVAGIGVPAESRGHGDWQWYPVDVAIAMQNLVLAATELGYGTCWIGAFDRQGVKRLLQIPPAMQVIALTPIGFPAVQPDPPPRKRWDQLFSEDTYGNSLELR